MTAKKPGVISGREHGTGAGPGASGPGGRTKALFRENDWAWIFLWQELSIIPPGIPSSFLPLCAFVLHEDAVDVAGILPASLTRLLHRWP
ncbi:MAG: hypothetical protein WCX22_02180 [Methanoregula sp.]